MRARRPYTRLSSHPRCLSIPPVWFFVCCTLAHIFLFSVFDLSWLLPVHVLSPFLLVYYPFSFSGKTISNIRNAVCVHLGLYAPLFRYLRPPFFFSLSLDFVSTSCVCARHSHILTWRRRCPSACLFFDNWYYFPPLLFPPLLFNSVSTRIASSFFSNFFLNMRETSRLLYFYTTPKQNIHVSIGF